MIKNLVDRQIEFQKKMNSNGDVMYLAFVEELGELVASFGFADWKKTVRDEANILIELVDLAVFAMNLEYYTSQPLKPSNPRPDYADWELLQLNTDVALVKELVKHLFVGDYNSIYRLIFTYAPETKDILTAKQALNQLRQDYGYKNGEYIKMWTDDREDNTFLEALYGLSFEEVYDSLETIYTTKIVPASLVNVSE